MDFNYLYHERAETQKREHKRECDAVCSRIRAAEDEVQQLREELKALKDEQLFQRTMLRKQVAEEWHASKPAAATPGQIGDRTAAIIQAQKSAGRLAKIIDRYKLTGATADDAIYQLEQLIEQMFIDVQNVSDPGAAERMRGECKSMRECITQLGGEPRPDPMQWSHGCDDSEMDRLLDTPKPNSKQSEDEQ